MHLDLPIITVPRGYNGHQTGPAPNATLTTMPEPQGFLRVPVWVIVLLVTIAGGLMLNGAATVYWAATFKQSFQDFKEDTYKQKTEHLEAEISRLQLLIKREEEQRKLDVDTLTERENDTRLRLAGRGFLIGK